MAVSEELQTVTLDSGDVDAGMALSSEAGWNQVGADWRLFIETGRAIGVRDAGGRLVGSAATLPYDGPFGFVGMVLVTETWRRRGVATRLVAECMLHLKGIGLIPALDATAAGEEVYRRQGFLPQFRFDRWEGTSPGRATTGADGADAARLAALDAGAFGAARPRLIEDFLAREGTRVFAEGGEAFAMVRRGRRAMQAGPVVAADENAALRLIERLCSAVGGALFIDVPRRWRQIGGWLERQGFGIQRSFARMALGRAEPFGDPARLFAVAGPEFG
jgi:GNAT superfamily N-acetyltransferase